MSIYKNQVFENDVIFIDGCSFSRCEIKNCQIVFSGHQSFNFFETKIIDSRWEFQGPALLTINALVGMQSGGFSNVVEQVIKSILNQTLTTETLQ